MKCANCKAEWTLPNRILTTCPFCGASLDNLENRDASQAFFHRNMPIAAGKGHIIGISTDLTVLSAGDDRYGQCDMLGFKQVVSVAAGSEHSVFLYSDGTVSACGNKLGYKCNIREHKGDVSEWKDIVAIAAGSDHTVGLRSDGTVVASGSFILGACNVEKWTDIVSIACGPFSTLGVKIDGTVVACGSSDFGALDARKWRDIIDLAVSDCVGVGLDRNGNVHLCGMVVETTFIPESQIGKVIELVAGEFDGFYALKADGNVICFKDNRVRIMNGWNNVVHIASGNNCLIGVTKEGTVLTYEEDELNSYKTAVKDAIEKWRLNPFPFEKSRVLREISDNIEENKNELA